MKKKAGRPFLPKELKRTRGIKFSQHEIEQFEALGYNLADGVRQAVKEFFERGVRNDKQ